jgi:glycosyltransferase involved in cell wall biosynthesis
MARVLLTHGYAMNDVHRLCAEGRMPRHHLWGAEALAAAGHEVQLGAFGPPSPLLRHLTWRTRKRLGDFGQQLGIARRTTSDTVAYVGEAGIVRGLAYLRAAHAWRSPLVAVFHAVPEPSAFERAWVRGVDVALCLSSRHRDILIERFGRDPATTRFVGWGPALDHPGYSGGEEHYVVSAGKTDRDVLTLTQALRDVGAAARVYAIAGEPAVDAPGIELVRPVEDGAAARPVDYTAVLADMRRASVVAIPLPATDRLLGLTELNDALALGKPVVMTRTPALDLDVERIGCGILVEPGDVEGWRAALSRLLADPDERGAMGRAGRRFAETSWNYEQFSEEVTEAVAAALDGRR